MTTPKLRFQDFNDSYTLEITDNHFTHIRNGFVGTATPYYTDNTGIKYLQSNNIKNGIINENTLVYINEEFHKKNSKSILKTNDILMVQSGHAGDCAVVTEKYNGCNCHALIVMTPKSSILSKYYMYYLHSPNGLLKVKKLITGNTIKHILASDVKNIVFPSPSLEEQNKIANFFTVLDNKIKLQREKIDLLKEQKKGYMQKIFRQELRFKDSEGSIYPDWENHILGNIGSTYTGLSGKTKEDFGYGNHSFITYVNVFNNLFANESGVEKVNILESENQATVQKGDILLTTSSETPLEVGMASIWSFSSKNLHLNSFCFGYRLNTDNGILPEFVAISLRSEYMRKKITLLAQGSTRFNMSKTQLMRQTIKIPSSLEEQRKIIDFYMSLESKVNTAVQKLELLRQQKQAFMQQMFI